MEQRQYLSAVDFERSENDILLVLELREFLQSRVINGHSGSNRPEYALAGDCVGPLMVSAMLLPLRR